MNVWELLSVVGKTLIYIGMLATIGGMLMLWLGRENPVFIQRLARRYTVPAALTGLLASCLVFVALIGSVNQNGITGMFDPVIGGILAEAAPGSVLRWRLAGFLLTLLALLPLNISIELWRASRVQPICFALLGAATLCFAAGVGSQGHAANVGLLAQFMAAAHFMAIAAWAGSLYPLYTSALNQEIDANTAALLAERFGQVAWAILGVMLVSGLVLIWQVAGGPGSLTDDTHGRLLIVKLVLVVLMMALGALHKFLIVPGLRTAVSQHNLESILDSRLLLARSIRSEALLALLVLVLAAAMTSVTGPVH